MIGDVELIIGPMFAGKSSLLLHKCEYMVENGYKVVIIKHKKDKRFSSNIITHNNDSFFNVIQLNDIYDENLDDYDVIAIDEGHFVCIYEK